MSSRDELLIEQNLIRYLGPLLQGSTLVEGPLDAAAAARAEPRHLPFSSTLLGRQPKVYHVRIPRFGERLRESAEAVHLPHIGDLTATLTARTHRLFKVASAPAPSLPPRPTPEEEEEQLRAGGESFLEVPEKPPAITLPLALRIARVHGPVDISPARELVAYYVRHQSPFYEKGRPVWLIDARDLAPIRTKGGPDHLVPEAFRNHIRNIIDAQSGQWLGADTRPQPRLSASP